jgi:hypothetical protein
LIQTGPARDWQIEVVKKEIEGGKAAAEACAAIAIASPRKIPRALPIACRPGVSFQLRRGEAHPRDGHPDGFRTICTVGPRKSVSARVD